MNPILVLMALLVAWDDPTPSGRPAVTQPKKNVELRKEARDQILEYIGPQALAFTKRYGDLAIAALQKCSQATGKRLVNLDASGELDKIKNIQPVLEAICRYGEPAALWFVNHHEQLVDPEFLECWCLEPLEYVFELKDLAQQASRLHANRKMIPPWIETTVGEKNMPAMAIGGFCLFIVLLLVLRRRPSSSNY